MTLGDAIPIHSEEESFYAPAFLLEVERGTAASSNGKPLPPAIVRDVMEIKYEDALDRVDGFTITVNNWDAEQRRPTYFCRREGEAPSPQEGEVFEPGRRLRLFMGYQGALRLMMTGYVTSVDVQFPETGPSRLTVSGLNVLDQLRLKEFSWSWPEDGAASVTDSAIARSLARPADDAAGKPGLGIPVEIDAAAAAREADLTHVFMNNQHPIDFLLQRARLRGYEVLLGQREVVKQAQKQLEQYIYFGPTSSVRQVTYKLEWGKSLASFHPIYGGAGQLLAVTVCGWDRKAKKRIEVRKTVDDLEKKPKPEALAFVRALKRERVITDSPVNTVAEAERLALATLEANGQQLIECNGSTVGLPDLRSGRMIEIAGTGRLFDLRYVVTSTTHVLNDSGYRTNFTARWQPGPPTPAGGRA